MLSVILQSNKSEITIKRNVPAALSKRSRQEWISPSFSAFQTLQKSKKFVSLFPAFNSSLLNLHIALFSSCRSEQTQLGFGSVLASNKSVSLMNHIHLIAESLNVSLSVSGKNPVFATCLASLSTCSAILVNCCFSSEAVA